MNNKDYPYGYLVIVKDITDQGQEIHPFFDALSDILQDDDKFPGMAVYGYGEPGEVRVNFSDKDAAKEFANSVDRNLFKVRFYTKIVEFKEDVDPVANFINNVSPDKYKNTYLSYLQYCKDIGSTPLTREAYEYLNGDREDWGEDISETVDEAEERYLQHLLRKEKVTELDKEERFELQDLIQKYGYPEEEDDWDDEEDDDEWEPSTWEERWDGEEALESVEDENGHQWYEKKESITDRKQLQFDLDNSLITKDEYNIACEIKFHINSEDYATFITESKEYFDLKNVESVSYTKPSENYDGAFEVTLKDGSKKTLEWQDFKKGLKLRESRGSARITGTWKDILDGLDELGYYVPYRYRKPRGKWITMDDGRDEYEAEVEKYSDGTYELMLYNINKVGKNKNLPDPNHVEYVLDQVMNWDRGDDLDKRSLKQICKACEEYDNNYTADEYAKVIKDFEMLTKTTKNSNYKLSESFMDEYVIEYDKKFTPEDIELHQKINWPARDYEAYAVPGTEYEGTTYYYGDDGLHTKKEPYVKYIRANQIYPPYYGPVNNRNTKDWTSAMYDGRRKDGYDIHDRRESWNIYDILSR